MKWEYVTRSQATIGYLQNEKQIFRNLTISSILSENEPSLSKQISMSLSRKTIVEIYLEEILFFQLFLGNDTSAYTSLILHATARNSNRY